MAASVYATPPPDLSSEDTALSDVSNSSQISSSSSQSKATKRNISSILLGSHSSAFTFDSNQNDQSKKRRKQSTPIRISAINLTSNFASIIEKNDQLNAVNTDALAADATSNNAVDAEQKLPKHIIPMLEQTMLLEQNADEQKGDENSLGTLEANISSTNSYESNELAGKENSNGAHDEDEEDTDEVYNSEQKDEIQNELGLTKQCKHCPEKFDSDIKLGVHILQCHAGSVSENKDIVAPPHEVESIGAHVKLEPDLHEANINENRIMATLPRPEDWLSMSTLNFPFPPEAAAAAITASSYLSQLPLLGVPPVGAFPNVDGLSRPPLRIFNPEAYCDLCNKEFCNKYFLKTHKANKHGIYDPASSNSESSTVSQINQISQALQMQFHQQQQQQHPQQQNPQQFPPQQTVQPPSQTQVPASQPEQKTGGTPEITVFCDICHKRFTNVFAMKRHRNKAHEIPPPSSPFQIKTENEVNNWNDKENTTPLRMPEGFREDFAVEQEDVSFTPQPRKLSPASSQQAREANFSVEKLKRLGVVNPEAFCDMCCKEYCNKYFLRTHKLKRHGILVPVDEEKFPWQTVQTTPLNLMVGSEKVQRKSVDSDGPMKVAKSDMDDAASGKHSLTDQHEIKSNDIYSSSENGDKSSHPVEESNSKQDPDAISIDLQKLQSMILQLNDLSNQRPVACHFCGKELENQYMLHAHITTDHAVDNNNLGLKSPRSMSPSTSGITQNEVCKHCEKEFNNGIELKQHLVESHGLSLGSPIREGFITPERPIAATSVTLPTTPTQTERRPPFTITPTSSYCEICNKELCNKYFMKTHMQRMHGIEIENGAQIGGVVCNICNKELCSKYFLRVHKHNTHGIVEEGSPLPQPRQNGEQPDVEGLPFSIDPSIKSEFADLSNRYFTHYTEVCPLCSRRFRSSKWLRAHLMSDHGKSGTEKLRELEQQMSFRKSSSPTLKIPNGTGLVMNNLDANFLAKSAFPNLIMKEEAMNASPRLKEYQCSICSFSTPYYAFLFIHERSHSFIPSPSPALSLKSENAVSIAKDQQRADQPSSQNTTTGTPTLTPASTPAPQTPQENASGIKRDRDRDREHDPKKDREIEVEAINSLSDLSNATNRPVSYAFPQRNEENIIMQSFLIEEIIPDGNHQTSPTASVGAACRTNGNSITGNVNHTIGDVKSEGDSSSGDGNINSATSVSSSTNGKKFIPAIIFLPVKERISEPITISFTLTPA